MTSLSSLDIMVDEGDSAFICFVPSGATLFRDVNITVAVMPISGKFTMIQFILVCC